MNLLKCATLIVQSVDDATGRFTKWLDYCIVESGFVPDDLAIAWNAPASAGRRYALCQPASEAAIFIRFIEGDLHPDYLPIRSFGWAAIEICVQDVLAVNDRMLASPFEVIGPPNRIGGLSTIFPMQVRGPDLETVYFTEILTDAADSGLPTAATFIDTLFIVVLACADLHATARWFADTLKLEISDPVAIRYSMIAKSFDLPAEQLHEIITAQWQCDICLEFDQYPEGAIVRPCHPGALPPGVAICTLVHPEFDRIDGVWLAAPVIREGPLYDGRLTGVLRTPEGVLIEIIDGR